MDVHMSASASSSRVQGYLEGQLLVATPRTHDGIFEKSVIYICVHNDDGAMGVIVNRKVENIVMADLFQHLKIDAKEGIVTSMPVHFGGPIEVTRGFILHSDDHLTNEELVRHGGIALTSSIHMLKDIADGKGPRDTILTLGYAGWGPGQLESEIAANGWITMPATPALVFGADNDAKWESAGRSLGLDIHRLSPTAGHA